MNKSLMKKNNLKISICFLLTVLFFNQTAFSAERSAQELILAGNPVYDMATAIFLEAGLWNFADSFPVTIQEMKFHLDEIDYDSLSEQGKKYYDAIYSWCAESSYSLDSHLLSVGLEPSVSLEGYYKTNDDVDWVFDKFSRKPLFDAPLKVSFSDYATVICDLYLGQNRSFMTHDDTYFNIPYAANQIDINFPTTAYLSAGTMLGENNGVSFQIGMSERAIGRTLSGSLIQSEYMEGATYAQLMFYGRKVKFTTSVTELNVNRYYYSHKLEIRLAKKFTFTAFEGALVAQPLELRFLNPLTIFHGFAPWRDYGDHDDMYNCSFLGVKAVYVPVKYLRIYGLFGLSQLQTSYERKNWPDNETPNGMGWQGGVESYIPVFNGYISSGLEFYYAQSYFYLKPSPNATMVRTYNESIGDMDNFYEWIGSPFGPDSIAVTAKIGYEVPKVWSVSLKYLFLAQGELADKKIFGDWGGTELHLDNDDYIWDGYPPDKNHATATGRDYIAERDRTTPSGTPQYSNVFSVSASYFPTNWIEIIGQPSVTFIFNNEHIHDNFDFAFEMTLACRMRLYSF